MQYFTFDWATGRGPDIDPIAPYRQFLETFDRAGAVYRFATSISLHDGYLDRAVYDLANGDLALLLLTGNLQIGYWRTELRYSDAEIENRGILAGALASRSSQVLYDEFAVADERLSHGFLLAPPSLKGAVAGQEFRISFSAFNFMQSAIPKRVLATAEDTSVWS